MTLKYQITVNLRVKLVDCDVFLGKPSCGMHTLGSSSIGNNSSLDWVDMPEDLSFRVGMYVWLNNKILKLRKGDEDFQIFDLIRNDSKFLPVFPLIPACTDLPLAPDTSSTSPLFSSSKGYRLLAKIWLYSPVATFLVPDDNISKLRLCRSIRP